MKGQVYKVHSDAYVVKTADGLIKVGARGNMRRANDKIVVGDFVNIENGVITSTCERKNYFPRPNVANIDTVVIVVSPEPKPDYILIDKLVVNALSRDLEIMFAVNKTDVNDGLYEQVKKTYEHIPAQFFAVSATTCTGLTEFSKRLARKLVLFAGQSAVGKTSLVNSIFGLNLKTGILSEKTNRGKHTTTYSEIHTVFGTGIIDTPGFAVIDAEVKSNELALFYPEYFERLKDCKFRGCGHADEPDCAVKRDVEKGILSKERYERYLQIRNELIEKEKYL